MSQSQNSGSPKKSTTVRAPWHIRTGFAAAERFAPGAAAKVLSRLWFRLPSSPEKRLRAPAPAGSAVFELESGGSTVWGYDWGDGPLVYLVHGWGGSSGDFKFIAANLVSHGFRVIGFDAPSHGNSGPSPWGERHSNGVHMADAFKTVLAKFGEPHAVAAHSLGCLTAVMALRDTDYPTWPRMAMFAPFVGGVEGFSGTLNSIVPVGPRILERVVPLAEDRAEVKLSQLTLLDPVVDAPTFIVHDKGDRPNPIRYGQALAESWPNAEIMATSGLGHRKILINPEVSHRAHAFIKG
ncbi:alpha/beta fold hydrolase [Glycomyces buryatensis]|uniref:Alpha/beta hydrolase n=1 Tax=Glycomyces buryatensis TaxID=2570927 RepID=A0A4S8QDL4_9ACTN|nr:alpha/beta hydrolase [Glycomyces buryatensis]THV42667.1 alpha/beta hydrolase [Glycomyces buryatensis]